jgi:predicted nuclease with TOPRIM domain
LELLDKDLEFRYTVAGYLGLSEILKRLEERDKRFEEVLTEIRALREDQHKLWENQNRLWENQNKMWEEIRALREGQNRLWEEVRELRRDVRDVKTTMERITLSVEEEARSFIAWRLKRELNVDVELDRAFVDAIEINVYGAVGDLCVVGEATVRLGSGLVEDLLKKVEVLRMKRPDLLRRRLLKVIYADVAVPQALQLAQEKGVWVLKRDRDLAPMKFEEALG